MRLCLGTVCVSRAKCRSLPPTPNERMHHMERHRWNQAWKLETIWRTRESYPQAEPLECAIISIKMYYAGISRDVDNLYASVKPILDGLKGLVIKDDRPENVRLSVASEKVARRADERVEIEVTPCRKI